MGNIFSKNLFNIKIKSWLEENPCLIIFHDSLGAGEFSFQKIFAGQEFCLDVAQHTNYSLLALLLVATYMQNTSKFEFCNLADEIIC